MIPRWLCCRSRGMHAPVIARARIMHLPPCTDESLRPLAADDVPCSTPPAESSGRDGPRRIGTGMHDGDALRSWPHARGFARKRVPHSTGRIRAAHLACFGHPLHAVHHDRDGRTADAIEIMGATDAFHAAGAPTIIMVPFDGGIDRHGAFVPCMPTHGTEARNRHRIRAESFAQAVDPERTRLCWAARALQPALHRRHASQAPCDHVDRFHAMTKGKILQGRQHERTHGVP